MATSQTKQRIIEAAAAEFGEKGFTGATTRAIAARAGVNEVTLFRHFGNKNELFAAVVQAMPLTPSVMDRTLALLQEMEPRQGLYELGLGQLTGLEQNLSWLRLQMLEPSSNPGPLRLPGFRLRSALADYLRRWQERGALRPDVDPALAAEAFAVAIFGFVMANRVVFPSENAPSPEQFVRTQVDLFLAGLEARA